jgi:hypothetical protein
MEPGADLMLLHPDGSEERLVEGGTGSVTDPFVSFDGEWVYYSLIRDLRGLGSWSLPKGGADIYKIHLKTRRIVRLTNQRFSPNTGAIARSSRPLAPRSAKMYFDYGVFNTGPCPLPGGRIMFTSNRDGFRPANGYPLVTLQLFTMDDRDEDIADDADPPNLEKIGHLNLGGALHPVPLKDGRVMFSSLESQGIRADILWGIWTIHPDCRTRNSSSGNTTTRTTVDLAHLSSCPPPRNRVIPPLDQRIPEILAIHPGAMVVSVMAKGNGIECHSCPGIRSA